MNGDMLKSLATAIFCVVLGFAAGLASINTVVEVDCGKYGQYVTENYKLTCVKK